MQLDTLQELKKAITGYDSEKASTLSHKVLEEGIDPNVAVEAVTEAIRFIGNEFSQEKIWLPELVGAADAMKSSMQVLEKEILDKGKKRESLGKVVIGTVKGDIHSIGEGMVATLLLAEGFEVLDMGVDVSVGDFIEAVKKNEPAILALSALMTTTAKEMENIIENLKKEGLREKVKLIVGGAPITASFAEGIGADGFSATAPGGAKTARKLV